MLWYHSQCYSCCVASHHLLLIVYNAAVFVAVDSGGHISSDHQQAQLIVVFNLLRQAHPSYKHVITIGHHDGFEPKQVRRPSLMVCWRRPLTQLDNSYASGQAIFNRRR